MRKLYFLIFVLFIVKSTTAQSCLPDGIFFSSQSEIDNFKENYPDCTEIEGYVEINGSGISNLDSLHQITSIGGYFEIYDVPDLSSIDGLSALTSIGSGRLLIHGSAITSLHGLENLVSVPGLRIDGNAVLSSLQGLNSLTTSAGGVYIIENPSLISLAGLESLINVGEGGTIVINYNESLTSLSGIDNLVFNPLYVTEIWIDHNPLLSECEVASICNLLDDEGIIHVNNNASGCNTRIEIEEACRTSVGELNNAIESTIYPNPLTTSTNLIYILSEPSAVTMQIFNSYGQLIEKIEQKQPKGEQKFQWNAKGLPTGMYYFRIQAGDKIGGGKLIVSD